MIRHGDNIPAKVLLLQDWILADGWRERIRPGMRVEAEKKIGERRAIEYLLSPVQESGEGKVRTKFRKPILSTGARLVLYAAAEIALMFAIDSVRNEANLKALLTGGAIFVGNTFIVDLCRMVGSTDRL